MGPRDVEGPVAGDVADTVVELAPVDRVGERTRQPSPDHGPIGFVDIRTHLRERSERLPGALRVRLGEGDRGPAGTAYGRRPTNGLDERAPPHRALDDLAVPRRPRGLGAGGDGLVREGRAELGSRRGDGPGEVLHLVPGGRDRVEGEDPPGPPGDVGRAPGPTGGVEPEARVPGGLPGGQGDVLGAGVGHVGVRPVPQVDAGNDGRDLVRVDGADGEVEAGQGHRVRADAAA